MANNGMQICIATGRVSKDFEWKKTNSNYKVGTFTIATTNCQYDKEARSEGTAFLEITCFDKKAEFCEKYLKKGEAIELKFHITNNSYKNRQGEKVFGHSFIADEIKFAVQRAKYLNGEIPEEQTDETMKAFKDSQNADFVNVSEGEDSELPFQ